MKNARYTSNVPVRFQDIGENIAQDVIMTLRGPDSGREPHCPDGHGSGRPERIDAVADFLAIYDGPRNGDLDVVVVDAFLPKPDTVVLRAVHAGPIGTTEGTAYVWGIDRGAGTELFPTLDPPAGEGVTFDAVVILLPDRTGSLIDLAGGGAPQALDPSSIRISGSVISVSLHESLLPSMGLAFEEYGYNLWPRFAPEGVNPLDNTQISDFAPDASTFAARARGRGDDWSPGCDRHEVEFDICADSASPKALISSDFELI
jgi:hypothetical protein